MKYVYIIRSVENPDQYYSGVTDNIEQRLNEHNTGKSPHTSKFKPWEIVVYTAFCDENKALNFEKYLKSGSGRAFAERHFK